LGPFPSLTRSSATSRCLIPADLGGRTDKHRFDALEPFAPLFGKGAARREYPTHQRQRLFALPAIGGQQLGKRRNRPLRIQQQNQILLLDDLLEPCEADALGGWEFSADLLQGSKPALVDLSFRKTHIDQRAYGRLDQTTLVDLLLEMDGRL